MNEFDDIRPYRDDEVASVLARLVHSDEAVHAAAAFLSPRGYRLLPGIAARLVRLQLDKRVRGLASVAELQMMFSRYFERVIERTTAGLTVTGLDDVPTDRACLFLSNHRDIALDSGLMNYSLWSAGRATSQIAVGDNLFTQRFATDLMRLNKSFVVRRSAQGPKAQLAAMSKTARYIRRALESGDSVWIAQRPGRAKDGDDRTEPALLKMFTLAYRKEARDLGGWLRQIALVPVTVSYELDPCAPIKARELYQTARNGSYQKPDDEDLRSMVRGIVGYKGRVSVAFGERIQGDFDTPEALAERIDWTILGNLTLYPTHMQAFDGSGELAPRVAKEWRGALAECAPEHVEYLKLQYANQVRNRTALAETPAVTVAPAAD